MLTINTDTTHFHFLVSDYSKREKLLMELASVAERKTNLSFSIENILREDFPKKRRVTRCGQKAPCFTAADSRFQRWPYRPVFYAVRYSPVIMQLGPDIQDMTARSSTISTEYKEENTASKPPFKEHHHDNVNCETVDEDEIPTKDATREKCTEENGAKRKRRNRSHFTQRQLQYLESIFSRQQYLTRDERTLLARGLEMTELQIRNWFQNRRYQKKNRAMDKKEHVEPDSSATFVKRKAI